MNMLEPLGDPVTVRAYVDIKHAGNVVKRRSCSGLILFLNISPVIWYIDSQNMVESFSFGSEFFAPRIET